MSHTKGIFSLIFVFVAIPLLGQNYGFLCGVGLLRGEGDFRQFSSIQDSVPFIGSGSSLGYNFGGYLNIPITRNIFLNNSFGIQFYSTTFSASRDFSSRFDSVKVQSKYILKMAANFQFNSLKLTYTPTLNFKVFPNLFLRSGFSLGYEFIPPKSINYMEEVFIKGSSSKTIYNEYKIEGKHQYPLSFTFDFGLYFILPWNFFGFLNIGALPYFSFGFSHIAKDFTADLTNLGLHLALQIDKLEKPKKQIEKIILPSIDSLLPKPLTPPAVIADTIKKQDSLEIEFVGIIKQNGGEKYTPAIITLTREIYDSKVPLLGYIFFDYSSYELPKKYKKISNPNDFLYSSLRNKSILEVYYDILNIIGYRLRQNPNANITLIGCNSNIGEEANNLELSMQRANSIVKYLIRVWEIEPERIKIEKQNLPTNPSSPKTPEGNSENQRVEIKSDDPVILSPISILDTSLDISPQYLRIFTKHTQSSSLSHCKIFFSSPKSDTLLKILNYPLDSFDLPMSPKVILNGISDSVLDIILEVSTNEDTTSIVKKVISLPIQYLEKRAQSQKKEKIILPPFNFNSSQINIKQIEFLRNYKEVISKAKSITLLGHTDIIGDKEYNLRLSITRANSIEEYLINELILKSEHSPDEKVNQHLKININKEALGERNTPFDNNLPEGRFLSRTVEMIIEY